MSQKKDGWVGCISKTLKTEKNGEAFWLVPSEILIIICLSWVTTEVKISAAKLHKENIFKTKAM